MKPKPVWREPFFWLILAAYAAAFLGLIGCASPPEVDALLLRQRQIGDCYAAGGRPHLGPGDTIFCQQ